MSGISERSSEGARLIIDVVDKADPRPVWLLAWGGANTIAQAIWTVAHTRDRSELINFLNKIRIYDLAAQDDAGAWIAKHYPDVFFIRNALAYKGMSFRFSSHDWDHTRGGNEEVVTREWVQEYIQDNHGALGQMYPDALHLWEGDTPTFFYLLPNGLNDPEQQWQGSWGGRFTREKQKNINYILREYAGADCSGGCFVNEEPYLDYYMYSEAADHWEYQEKTYDNIWAAIFRWREAFQNDFAARMDWCIAHPGNTNHPPVPIVNQDSSRQVIYLESVSDTSLSLDASMSYDPDQDVLEFQWWVYQEAGTFEGELPLNAAYTDKITLSIPALSAYENNHLIFSVTDRGSPALTRYRRVVINGTP